MKIKITQTLGRKIFITGCLLFGLVSVAEAAVTGACSGCHTMHASQNGAMKSPDGATTLTAASQYLLINGCVGCHSDSNGHTGGTTPIIWRVGTEPVKDGTTGGPVSNSAGTYLAGGDFYWVKSVGDEYGHNVEEVDGDSVKDSNMPDLTPPGWSTSTTYDPPSGGSVATREATWSAKLTCSGVYGCHGQHNSTGMKGSHHGSGAGYRFLFGIDGTEDTDWEYTFSSSDHNGYDGEIRSDDTTVSVADKTTISFLCAECHSNFHSGSGADGQRGTGYDAAKESPWIRHPTDIDIAAAGFNGTEYDAYATYDPLVPVANSGGAVISTTVQTAGNGIITCVTCHRAHGSPFADLMRWDYGTEDAHSEGSDQTWGCYKCHSTKDT